MHTSLITKSVSTEKRAATHPLGDINLCCGSYNKTAYGHYYAFFNLILLTLLLGTSCSNKRITQLKDIPYQSPTANQNTQHNSRLPSTLGFIPDWNLDTVALPADVAKITTIPQNWQYYEPINDDLICYYYRRTNNPKSYFPNLPSNSVNDNEYEAWLWNKKHKKVQDIRTGGITPIYTS